ncbi:MAG: DUF2852 domain-containing protein [Rhizobiaceae bacterium]
MNTATTDAGQPAGPNGRYGFGHRHGSDGDFFWWAKTPGFNPFKLLAVIAGFAVFPPLGIAALVYFLWAGRRARRGEGQGHYRHGRGCGRHGMGRSGNAAFDEHQNKVREELDTERRDFEAWRSELRRKRDAEAFEAFKANRANTPETPEAGA